MAEYELKEGDFVLFKNNNKKTENHPDYTGNTVYKGEKRWLSGWVKKSKSGMDYLSGVMGDVIEENGGQRKSAKKEEPPFDI